jgi:hypothetical protein
VDKFGIAQDEYRVERLPEGCKHHVGGVGTGSTSWQPPGMCAQAGAAHQVSMRLVAVLAALPGTRSAGAVRLPAGVLNFSDAQN